ncbi:MAG: hypothetical protein WC836_11435, partial [Desulfobacula sp.]
AAIPPPGLPELPSPQSRDYYEAKEKRDAEIKTRIDRNWSLFTGVVNEGTDAFERLERESFRKALRESWDGIEIEPRIMPLFYKLTDSEIKGFAVDQIRQTFLYWEGTIKREQKCIPAVSALTGVYADLETKVNSNATPVIGTLKGLGVAEETFIGPLKDLLGHIGSRRELIPQYVKTWHDEIEILEYNIPLLKREYRRRVDEAKAFLAEDHFSDVDNAAGLAASTADEVCKAAREANLDAYQKYDQAILKVKKDVREMFAAGELVADVRAYIENARAPFIGLYEKAAKVPHMVKLVENTKSQSDSKYAEDPRSMLAEEMMRYYPDEGISKSAGPAAGQYNRYMLNNTQECIRMAAFIEGYSFKIADQMNEFLPVLAKIETVNKKIVALFGTKPYLDAVHEMPGIVAELDPDKDYLSQWVKSYASSEGKKTGMLQVISKETSRVIDTARLDYEAKQTSANQEKDKAEEERKPGNEPGKPKANIAGGGSEKPDTADLRAVSGMYDRFRQAYESRSDSEVISFMGDDWEAGDGTTLSELQANINRSFKIFDEIKYEIQNLKIQQGSSGKYVSNYDVIITSRIYKRNIKHEEKSSVSEEVTVDTAGRPRISKTLAGRFWYVE